MPFRQQDGQNIQEFFEEIACVRDGYRDDTFNYVAVGQNGTFFLIQGILFLNAVAPQAPSSHVRTLNIRAGQYRLSELGVGPEELVQRLGNGTLDTPDGPLLFPADNAVHTTSFIPFHPVGLQNQSRVNVLSISGGAQANYLRQPYIDWELKAAQKPYDGLQEVLFEYRLGNLTNDRCRVDVFATSVAVIDRQTNVSGTTANVFVRAADGLNKAKVRVGYRAVGRGETKARGSVDGSDMRWSADRGTNVGHFQIEIPKATALECIASFDGIAQSHYWVADQKTILNPRRAAYEAFDPQVATLKEIVTSARSKGDDARELEAAIAWLLWMLGFSVAHLGGTKGMHDAADLIATTPSGHFAVVECTTGQIKADKVAHLHERTEGVRTGLANASAYFPKVIAVLVTSKGREEVKGNIEQAKRLGILVLTRESIDDAINRTVVVSDADQFYNDAEAEIIRGRSAGSKGVLQLQ